MEISVDYSDRFKRPEIRELTLANGISYPTDEELIMLILGRGSKCNPINSLACDVLEVIRESKPADLVKNLTQIKGVGESKALAVAAALELGRRKENFTNKIISHPAEIVPYVKHFTLKPTEHFVTVTLTGAREILSIRLASIGTTNRALVHPREIFAEPVSEHASAIICCHNHPSGHCFPSNADIESTRVLEEASSVLGIALLDHIILTKDGYYSFLENKMLRNTDSF